MSIANRRRAFIDGITHRGLSQNEAAVFALALFPLDADRAGAPQSRRFVKEMRRRAVAFAKEARLLSGASLEAASWSAIAEYGRLARTYGESYYIDRFSGPIIDPSLVTGPRPVGPGRGLDDVLRGRLEAEHPTEQLLALSVGELRSGDGDVAIAATDEAVYLLSSGSVEMGRVPYPFVREARVDQPSLAEELWETQEHNFTLADMAGSMVHARLPDPSAFVTVIDDQLKRITKFERYVNLTPEGGARFRWRKLGDDFAWEVTFDPSLLNPDPGPDFQAAVQAAIPALNRERTKGRDPEAAKDGEPEAATGKEHTPSADGNRKADRPNPNRFKSWESFRTALNRSGYTLDPTLMAWYPPLQYHWNLGHCIEWLQRHGYLTWSGNRLTLNKEGPARLLTAIRRELRETPSPATVARHSGAVIFDWSVLSDGLAPPYGEVYVQEGDRRLTHLGGTERLTTAPGDKPLVFEAVCVSRFGDPLRDLPPDTFHRAIIRHDAMEPLEKEMNALIHLHDLRRLDLGYSVGDVEPHLASSLSNLDECAARIGGFPSLEEIAVVGGITDQGLRHLERLSVLTAIELAWTKCTGKGLSRLPVSQLRRLHLNRGRQALAGELDFLEKCHSLDDLSLRGAGVTDPDLCALGAISGLRKLDLSWNSPRDSRKIRHGAVSNAAMPVVARLLQLEAIDLSWTDVDDEGISILDGLGELHTLRVCNTLITDGAAPTISGFTQLTSLDLSDTSFSDQGCMQLVSLENLKTLRLAGTSVEAGSVDVLLALPQLEKLDLSFTKTDVTDLTRLEAHPNLRELNVPHIYKPDEMSRLRAALPNASLGRW